MNSCFKFRMHVDSIYSGQRENLKSMLWLAALSKLPESQIKIDITSGESTKFNSSFGLNWDLVEKTKLIIPKHVFEISAKLSQMRHVNKFKR